MIVFTDSAYSSVMQVGGNRIRLGSPLGSKWSLQPKSDWGPQWEVSVQDRACIFPLPTGERCPHLHNARASRVRHNHAAEFRMSFSHCHIAAGVQAQWPGSLGLRVRTAHDSVAAVSRSSLLEANSSIGAGSMRVH